MAEQNSNLENLKSGESMSNKIKELCDSIEDIDQLFEDIKEIDENCKTEDGFGQTSSKDVLYKAFQKLEEHLSILIQRGKLKRKEKIKKTEEHREYFNLFQRSTEYSSRLLTRIIRNKNLLEVQKEYYKFNEERIRMIRSLKYELFRIHKAKIQQLIWELKKVEIRNTKDTKLKKQIRNIKKECDSIASDIKNNLFEYDIEKNLDQEDSFKMVRRSMQKNKEKINKVQEFLANIDEKITKANSKKIDQKKNARKWGIRGLIAGLIVGAVVGAVVFFTGGLAALALPVAIGIVVGGGLAGGFVGSYLANREAKKYNNFREDSNSDVNEFDYNRSSKDCSKLSTESPCNHKQKNVSDIKTKEFYKLSINREQNKIDIYDDIGDFSDNESEISIVENIQTSDMKPY